MKQRSPTLASLAGTLVLMSILLLPASGAAQSTRDMIKSKTLANGLEVVVIPSPSVPLVTIEICVKNGAFTEPPEFNGLSHLYEHMFFKGNAVIQDQEAYLKRMRQLGIVFNGTTTTERVNYYFTLPSSNLGDGLQFMRDAIVTPKFDPGEFEKEKKVVLGEVDRNESNPYYWFQKDLQNTLWFAHPSRKDSLGDRKTIETATVAKMRQMQQRYYLPNNSVLVVAGDVKPEDVFLRAEQAFRSWRRGPNPAVEFPVPNHPPLTKNEAFITERAVQIPAVSFAWHGPSVAKDPKATFAADVLSYILSQPTSRFQKSLVESGLVLDAGLSYYTQRYTGPISLTARMKPDRLEQAVPLLLAEARKLANPDYFSDEQLETAKTILAIQDVYEREKVSSFAHTVSFWWASAGLDYYLDYVENLRAVTRADIVRYVTTYMLGKPYVVGAIVSPEVGKQLKLSPTRLGEMARATPASAQ